MSSILDRPVVILGAPRGGTSILGRLLQVHPAFVHLREPRLIWRYGNDRKSDQLSANDARPYVVRYIRSRFERSGANSNGHRLLEKTPSNSLRIPFVEQVLPDAKYVHITRNGVDSALSIRSFWLGKTSGLSARRLGDGKSILRQRLQEAHLSQLPYYTGELVSRILPAPKDKPRTLWGPRLPGLSQMVREMELIEVAAMQWRQCVELATQDGSALGPDRYIEVRLEDLDLEKVEAILEFVGLKMTDQVAENFRTNFNASMHKERRLELCEEDLYRLKRLITPTMDWLGYKFDH